ncbi:Cilia- and flagella-associated protein 99 [Branchiostoma belcheri]|nr:Cilia- and flagella-associated protein 99 [Branchiostoma belcheri]
MSHKKLLACCVELLDTFNPEENCVEDHLKHFLKKNKSLDENDQTFIVEVFSGCVRYAPIMKVVVDGFYNVKEGKRSLRSERNIYITLCYMTVFRLDELGIVHFSNFVKSQDVNRMHNFFSFFLADENLKKWIKDEWCKHYDPRFTQDNLLRPLHRWMPELEKMISQLADKVANKNNLPKKVVKPATQPQEFNITQPKPRAIPVPERIPKLHKHRPEILMDANRFQFRAAISEKSAKTKKIMSEIMDEEDSKLDFEKNRARPLPRHVTENIPIKLNTAAILREGALVQKKEDHELKKLLDLEAGAKDASEFLEWQQKMRQKDYDEQLAEIERRRLEGKLSHEEAILARQTLVKENRQKVQDMKDETQQLMQEYVHQRMQDEKEMKRLVEIVMSSHKNAIQAREQLREYKRKIVEEVNIESQELLRQALEDEEEEMKRKFEIIQQIRAMEAVPVVRQKFVDLASTAGHQLLSELSILELKERLGLMKEAQRKAEEEKRDEILTAKQGKDKKLMDTLEQISRHRAETSKAAALRLEKKRATSGKKPEVKDPKLQDLEKKLQEKKAERLREAEKMKIKSDKKSAGRTQELAREKKALEENRWKELERTKEKQAKLVTQGIRPGTRSAQILNRSPAARKVTA